MSAVETDDEQLRKEELAVMDSIYGNDSVFMANQSAMNGVISVPIELEHSIIVKPPEADKSPLTVRYLPPVRLEFSLPDGYPSKEPPHVRVISNWLTPTQMIQVWQHLRVIWRQAEGNIVLYDYTQFLMTELATFLGLTHTLDVSFFVERARQQGGPSAGPEHAEQTVRTAQVGGRQSPSEKMPSTLTKTANHSAPSHTSYEKSLPSRRKSPSATGGRLLSTTCPAVERTAPARERPRPASAGKHSSSPATPTDRHASSPATPTDRHTCTQPGVCGDSAGRLSPTAESAQPPGTRRQSSVEQLRTHYRLTLPPAASIHHALAAYHRQAEALAFQNEKFHCKACYDHRSGSDCVRLSQCGHIYCRNCLNTYYTMLIRDGEVQSLRCPEDDCTQHATPDEVRDLVEPELFERYDTLLLKTTLSSMTDVVTCPRLHCQKPVVLDGADSLARCAHCEHTFCAICQNAYHGNNPCSVKTGERLRLVEEYRAASDDERRDLEKRYGRRQLQKLVEEVQSSNWLDSNSERCPHCRTPIEKIDGCNKMSCTKCGTLFCWLCNKQLSRENPYMHFNKPGTRCFNNLFEGVAEDQNDDEWAFQEMLDNIYADDGFPMGFFA